MSENKTKPTGQNVEEFLETIENPQKRKDSYAILALMHEITGEKAVMWGPAMIGFGKYHYKYESGREGDFFLCGFSPGKQNLSLYIMTGFEKYKGLMAKPGKYKTGKSCLYINKLDDIDRTALKELVKLSVEQMRKKYA